MSSFVMPYGKHVGKCVSEIKRVDPEYYRWALKAGVAIVVEYSKIEEKPFLNSGLIVSVDSESTLTHIEKAEEIDRAALYGKDVQGMYYDVDGDYDY